MLVAVGYLNLQLAPPPAHTVAAPVHDSGLQPLPIAQGIRPHGLNTLDKAAG
ncbi:hypothetical protein QOM21_00030 [Streptomyces sp. Pv4-95]|uniref:hypothetical protein n=1 Tax=Streptomyces sp. Pv4-95 TaxID=3049543 RepID=UPI003892B652